jgi:hypothetical protein
MAEARINVPLSGGEITALIRMAEMDCRQPREQLRFLLREEASKRGLLPCDQQGAPELDGQRLVVSGAGALPLGEPSETPHRLAK